MALSYAARLTAGMVLTAMVAGCANGGPNGGNDNQAIGGAAIGAVVGGLAGAAFGGGSGKAVAIGALAGALVGGVVGHQLDERDRAVRDAALRQSMQQANPNQTMSWSNPNTGNSGTVTPLNSYTAPVSPNSTKMTTCRDFDETYNRDGQSYSGKAKYCRDAKGDWQPAS
jgi:surface antigen